ncbi:hypothetical protein HK101_011501 [Irineochytrium annulatum]|nr:hypothetical protein HK101_011501 [Irineochytrium annulatum]
MGLATILNAADRDPVRRMIDAGRLLRAPNGHCEAGKRVDVLSVLGEQLQESSLENGTAKYNDRGKYETAGDTRCEMMNGQRSEQLEVPQKTVEQAVGSKNRWQGIMQTMDKQRRETQAIDDDVDRESSLQSGGDNVDREAVEHHLTMDDNGIAGGAPFNLGRDLANRNSVDQDWTVSYHSDVDRQEAARSEVVDLTTEKATLFKMDSEISGTEEEVIVVDETDDEVDIQQDVEEPEVVGNLPPVSGRWVAWTDIVRIVDPAFSSQTGGQSKPFRVFIKRFLLRHALDGSVRRPPITSPGVPGINLTRSHQAIAVPMRLVGQFSMEFWRKFA